LWDAVSLCSTGFLHHQDKEADMRLLTLTIVILFFSACTTVPEQLEGPFPEISPVRVEPGVYGSNVRWGGVIMSTEVLGNRTCFEVRPRRIYQRA
jgi:starvation-inducible outer membrane lipoprotein